MTESLSNEQILKNLRNVERLVAGKPVVINKADLATCEDLGLVEIIGGKISLTQEGGKLINENDEGKYTILIMPLGMSVEDLKNENSTVRHPQDTVKPFNSRAKALRFQHEIESAGKYTAVLYEGEYPHLSQIISDGQTRMHGKGES